MKIKEIFARIGVENEVAVRAHSANEKRRVYGFRKLFGKKKREPASDQWAQYTGTMMSQTMRRLTVRNPADKKD